MYVYIIIAAALQQPVPLTYMFLYTDFGLWYHFMVKGLKIQFCLYLLFDDTSTFQMSELIRDRKHLCSYKPCNFINESVIFTYIPDCVSWICFTLWVMGQSSNIYAHKLVIGQAGYI